MGGVKRERAGEIIKKERLLCLKKSGNDKDKGPATYAVRLWVCYDGHVPIRITIKLVQRQADLK
jgi:hypothetical protein